VKRPAEEAAPCKLLFPSTDVKLETAPINRNQQHVLQAGSSNDDLYNNAVMVAMKMGKQGTSVTRRGDSKADKFVAELSVCLLQREPSISMTSNDHRLEPPLTFLASTSSRHNDSSPQPHLVSQSLTYDDALMAAMTKERTKTITSARDEEEGVYTTYRNKIPSWKTTSVFKGWNK
jgi:hypothetical protein